MIAIMKGVEIVKGGFKSSAEAIAALKRGDIQEDGELFIGSEPVLRAAIRRKLEEKVEVQVEACKESQKA